MLRLQQSLEATSSGHRFDVIYQEYIDMLKRHHDRRERLPIELKLFPKFNAETAINRPAWIYWDSSQDTLSSSLQFQLMHEIIQHIAIIGQPVRGATLAYCPTIHRLAQQLIAAQIDAASKCGPEDDRTQTAQRKADLEKALDYSRDVPFVVCQMLGLLEYRCLVLRVSFAKAGKEQNINKARFTVHHRVQRHVFHQLGGQYNEYQNVDLYILTLYATQPSDLPRLSFDAYRQITGTIEHLIGYPEKGGWYHTYCKLPLGQRSRMLRSAFGMMRSIYSIGVLARFDQFGGIDTEDPVFGGHFERYRRMLRWVLASAARMDDEYQEQHKAAAEDPLARSKLVYNPPFYIDEIIWIHNECAVLSMIQGRMPDARALFDVGLSLARQSVEPDPLGPLNVRLLLNRAVVDIERGALGEARASLESVERMPRELEHPVPPFIATGYLGLIEYLSGNLDSAEQRFKDAVEGLAKQGRTRAESIFTRYWADLLRVRGTEEAKEHALEKADAALRLAHEGGHEDIRHYAQLSRIKIFLKSKDYAERSAEIYRALDVVERYALVIGVPRLICEVSDVRARLLLKQGERRLAISLAARALEIATMHDLKLRKVTAMGTLAMAISQRGMPHEATTLLNSALSLAKSIGHTLAQARLEQELDRTPR